MPLNLDNNSAKYQIRAYKPGHLQVNDLVLTESVIIAPEKLITDWSVPTVTELTYDALLPILDLHPTILLIGTGATHVFIPAIIYTPFLNQGIGVEVMSTASAARTYNALSAEERQVVAAMIIR